MGCKTTILAPSPYSTFSTFSIFHTSNPPSFGIKKIHDGWSRFPVFLLRPPFVFPPKLFSWQQSAVDATPPFRSRASIIPFLHSRGAKYAPRCNQPLRSSWIVATRSSSVGTRAQRKNRNRSRFRLTEQVWHLDAVVVLIRFHWSFCDLFFFLRKFRLRAEEAFRL